MPRGAVYRFRQEPSAAEVEGVMVQARLIAELARAQTKHEREKGGEGERGDESEQGETGEQGDDG